MAFSADIKAFLPQKMFTFAKPLHEITENDLQRLIDDQVVENRQLEYKRELPGTRNEDKKQFVRDVVSFANSAGGHIIYGIAESNGGPTQFTPISEDEIDEAKLRLENIIRTSIEPTIQGLKIDSVKLATGRALIIAPNECPNAKARLSMMCWGRPGNSPASPLLWFTNIANPKGCRGSSKDSIAARWGPSIRYRSIRQDSIRG